MSRKIQTALISVYHKDGLEEILQELNKLQVKFISTGGTHEFITSLGYECETVEEVSGYPSILGGRVKLFIPKSLVAYYIDVKLSLIENRLKLTTFHLLIL